MASCLSVLRFRSHGSEDSLNILIQRIADHFRSSAEPNNESLNSPGTATITVSNRYFKARVLLDARKTITSVHPEGEDLKEDGIVLLANADQSADLATSLSSIHEEAVAAGGGDLLRLCVALGEPDTSNMTPKEIEEDYSQRILWCLDRGYEFVSSCDLSDAGVARGHDDRDKEGFARLIEAIQGTVWSSAVMEKTKKTQLAAAYAEARNHAGPKEAAQSVEASVDTNARIYQPPDPSLFQEAPASIGASEKDDRAREQKVRDSLLEEVKDFESKLEVPGSSPSNQTDDEESRNEHLMEEFEGALQQAARIRDMSQQGQLSDADRRQRAGDAALLLMDLMGKMGLDEDDSDAEDSSDAGVDA